MPITITYDHSGDDAQLPGYSEVVLQFVAAVLAQVVQDLASHGVPCQLINAREQHTEGDGEPTVESETALESGANH